MATQLVYSSEVNKEFHMCGLRSTGSLREYKSTGLTDRDMSSSNVYRQIPARTQGRSASISESNQSMVCVDCFRAKGDSELRIPCQNPKCHFYLQQPQVNKGIIPVRRHASVSHAEYYLSDPGYQPTFNREVGHDRRGKVAPQFTYPSRPSTSNYQIWAYPPVSPSGTLYSNRMNGHTMKMRSQSLSLVGEDVDDNQSGVSFHNDKISRSRLRARMTSVPVSEGNQLLEQDYGELVEDAFVCSPLPTSGGGEQSHGEGKRRLGTPDTDIDSGIGSPFGRPSCSSVGMFDWMDPTSKPQTAMSLSTTVTNSCLPTYSVASALSTKTRSSTFDMSGLNAEIKSCSDRTFSPTGRMEGDIPKSPVLSATSGLSSPDVLKRFLMSGQFTNLLNTTDTYSRKVFVGGLPPDIDDEEIRNIFVHYGPLTVDWPHKVHTKACIPPKGYAFLLFKEESSVHKLLLSCFSEDDNYFVYIPTSTMAQKKVQIRPWYVSDSQYFVVTPEGLDSRKAVFVGGVPRPLKASELSHVMEKKYGSVTLVAIDCDSDLKYPKGAACVVFSSHASYIAAVSARFMQLNYGNMDKKIEIKPYVLDGQMCDECHGVQCSGKPAPFFCGSVTCLQYFCEYCWATVHSLPGRQNHRPLQKDIGDKTRYY